MGHPPALDSLRGSEIFYDSEKVDRAVQGNQHEAGILCLKRIVF